MVLTAVDLFCGIGGLSLGLKMTGEIRVLVGVEYHPPFCETYARSCGDKVIEADITKLKSADVLAECDGWGVDIVAGGPPCQSYSITGKRMGTRDPRGNLYKDFIRFVRGIRPRIVIMENVPDILTIERGRVVGSIHRMLRDVGYKSAHRLLVAADYGVPQTRKRFFMIARNDGKPITFPRPTHPPRNYVTVGEALCDPNNPIPDGAPNHEITKHSRDVVDKYSKLRPGESAYPNFSQAAQRLDERKPAKTVLGQHGTVSIHPRLDRTLTVRELCRLQEIPDIFEIYCSKSDALVGVGNMIPVGLGRAVGAAVVNGCDGMVSYPQLTQPLSEWL